MAGPTIRVTGLHEFRGAIARLPIEATNSLRAVEKQSAQLIADDARPKVPLGPGRNGHARSSIKVVSLTDGAGVVAGGPKFPYYPWLDFGGRVGRKKRTKRPFLKTGRYVWKSYDDLGGRINDNLREAVIEACRAAGLEVTG